MYTSHYETSTLANNLFEIALGEERVIVLEWFMEKAKTLTWLIKDNWFSNSNKNAVWF